MKNKNYSGRSVPKKSGKKTTYGNYRTSRDRKQGKFNKSKLPSPITVLKMLGLKPGKANSSGYYPLGCPFHKNGQEQHPSLNVHEKKGNYKCHACLEKGGNILDFYMKVTGKGFVEAAKMLGAWEVTI
jgi:hypothetical protein